MPGSIPNRGASSHAPILRAGRGSHLVVQNWVVLRDAGCARRGKKRAAPSCGGAKTIGLTLVLELNGK